MTLLDQLKERRLVQIVLSYIAGGWILLQVVDQWADRGILPDLVYHVALIWFVAGIPAALLVGWHHGEKGNQKAPVSELVLLLLILVTAVGASGLTIAASRSDGFVAGATQTPLEMRSIAVRYFNDMSGDGEFRYLADGLTEALIAELQQVQGLSVVTRSGSERFRDPTLAPDSVARALRVGTLVEGDVERRGGELRVQLRVLDAAGNVFRRTTIESPMSDLLTLQQSVVGETAVLLRQWIGEEVRLRDRAQATQSSAAWALVQRAESARKQADERFRAGAAEEGVALLERADALLADAETADPAWVTPVTERAFVAYRRSRTTRSPAEQEAFVATGLAHAERALAREPTLARALELRGTLNYWALLSGIESDPVERERLLERARSDLEAAVRFDASLASAHASLSHLYLYFTDNVADAVVAASAAYRHDAYLENVEGILDRLFNSSLDLGNFRSAKGWCDEGEERFPADARFVNCRLMLLMAPFETAVPDSAWALLARLESVAPAPTRHFQVVRGEMMVGAVLGRAGLTDSARVVIDRASRRVTAEIDPGNDLLVTEAYARIRSGEHSRAVDLLTRRFAAAGEQARTGGEVEWWWRDLQDDPRFRRLWGLD